MRRHSGEVNVDGSLAYVPQQPYLLNATLRDNVLFCLPFDKDRSLIRYVYVL